MNPDHNKKVIVSLFSDANFLSLSVLENLLSKNCYVNVFTNDFKKWGTRTAHLNTSNFSIIDFKKSNTNQDVQYAVFIVGFVHKESAYVDLLMFIKKINISGKNLIVLPFETFDAKETNKLKINPNSAVVYVGDIFGPRMDLESDLLAPSLINEILQNREITVGVGEVFYPIFVSSAAKTLTTWLFSFGPYGKETFLMGQRVSSTNFWKVNSGLVSGVELKLDNDIPTRILPRGYEIKNVEDNLVYTLTETYKWFREKYYLEKKPRIVKKTKTPDTPQRKLTRKLIALSLIVLIFPFITTIISLGLFYISYQRFLVGDVAKTENSLLLAKTFFAIGANESNILKYVPLVGVIYKETDYVSELGVEVSQLAVHSIPLIRSSSELFNKILGTEVYETKTLSDPVSQSLPYVYQDLFQINEITNKFKKSNSFLAAEISKKFDIERYMNLAKQGALVASKLPGLLGGDSARSYLLLFENNMELRPTGGFIGSYGVMSLDKGRLNSLNINDIYSADGQLKGHIEPPAPIVKYLGEANWWFRDSNWDPDFPTSAQRAEWFLDKETDQQVDGVFSVDLQLTKDILKETGPVFLPDFNLDITADNIYEKTQEEVQSDFFPGTHKKANFLTALSRELVTRVSKMDTKEKIHILKSIFDNLESRHIQIYLHDSNTESALTSAGWGGAVTKPNCGDTCFPDLLGIVEANVGVNKANYFIKRSVDLNVFLGKTGIIRTLNLSLKNQANPALGLAGKYKVYVRFLIPDNSEQLTAKLVLGNSESGLSPDITETRGLKEAGMLVEIPSQQEGKIVFSWQTPIEDTSEIKNYGLFVRKQAGITDDPWRIAVESNIGKLTTFPEFSLTKEGTYTYNTVLARDFVTKVTWH